jgi:hypothetical protein
VRAPARGGLAADLEDAHVEPLRVQVDAVRRLVERHPDARRAAKARLRGIDRELDRVVLGPHPRRQAPALGPRHEGRREVGIVDRLERSRARRRGAGDGERDGGQERGRTHGAGPSLRSIGRGGPYLVPMKLVAMAALLLGCGTKAPAGPPARTGHDAGEVEDAQPSPSPERFVLRGGTLAGGARADVEIADGRIMAVGTVAAGLPEIDVAGRFLAPAFIDSHVHLAYYPVAAELAAGGVAGAVDLAAPIDFLAEPHAPLRVVAAGPMITAVDGYPLNSWGRDGYGLACGDRAAALAAVERLAGLGAGVIKIPLAGDPELSDDALRGAVDRAHALGLPVTSHALGDADARRAADAGVDALAHTPVETLSEATLEAWRSRVVVSTLGAFGGASSTVENLASLRAHGATVLYGTDLGNTRTAAIDPRELDLLEEAGLDGAAILEAGTAAPAAFWRMTDLGAIAVGKAASLLVLEADPTRDPDTLTRPVAVYVDGVAQ